jgi:hypothetical protein
MVCTVCVAAITCMYTILHQVPRRLAYYYYAVAVAWTLRLPAPVSCAAHLVPVCTQVQVCSLVPCYENHALTALQCSCRHCACKTTPSSLIGRRAMLLLSLSRRRHHCQRLARRHHRRHHCRRRLCCRCLRCRHAPPPTLATTAAPSAHLPIVTAFLAVRKCVGCKHGCLAFGQDVPAF